jgi:hypothetical protein
MPVPEDLGGKRLKSLSIKGKMLTDLRRSMWKYSIANQFVKRIQTKKAGPQRPTPYKQ